MSTKRISSQLILVLGLWAGSLLLASALAHEKHRRLKSDESVPRHEDYAIQTVDALKIINKHYLREIKPIFTRACFDCHSDKTHYPWYYVIPGAKQWINRDIRTARKHLDMREDFPFKSHANPLEDLQAIGNAVQQNQMPPLRYRIFHQDNGLTPNEKMAILHWVEAGKAALQTKRRR